MLIVREQDGQCLIYNADIMFFFLHLMIYNFIITRK